MHKDLIIDNLELIIESINLIEQRFLKVNKPEDFVRDSEGVIILDSICMRLQNIGELVKKIDKIDRTILLSSPGRNEKIGRHESKGTLNPNL